MKNQKNISLKQRAELLYETIADFKEIGGFSDKVVKKYQKQLEEVLSEIDAQKLHTKLKRKKNKLLKEHNN